MNKHDKHIDMNFAGIRKELDRLYACLNKPYDIVPEWCGPGVLPTELLDVEKRLGVKLPPTLKLASLEFGGIHHETPYFLAPEFQRIREEVILKSMNELTEDDFQDDLVISDVSSPQEWGCDDELKALRAVEHEGLEDIKSTQMIAVDCDLAWLKNNKFMLIGTTYSTSLFINLIDENDANYGAMYNSKFLWPFYVIYKVADDYGSFLMNIKDSLQKKITLEAMD